MKNSPAQGWYIWLITMISVASCTEHPEACFLTDKSEYEISESIRFENCSKNSDSYLWDFSDGSNSSDFIPIHSFSDTGSYSVKLKAYAEYKGSNDVYTDKIHIIPSNQKFINTYYSIQDSNVIEIQSGLTLYSIEMKLNGLYDFTGECLSNQIIFNKQATYFNNYKLLNKGIAKLNEDSLFLLFEFVKTNEALVSFSDTLISQNFR